MTTRRTVVDRHRHRHGPTTVNSSIPKPSRVCFSYAAYAKNLIYHLQSLNIPVEEGLSDAEFTAVESSNNFRFPPDLRAILREGLPVAPGFPNWRSSSIQQLEILMDLPIRGICMEVSRNGFWIGVWGDKPESADQAVRLAEEYVRSAPILVPVYRDFYMPAAPCAAGNPVFYARGGDVRLRSFDVGGFFQGSEFGIRDGSEEGLSSSDRMASPAWAATEARRIEFWSEMAERVINEEARCETRGWWSAELGGCLEEVRGRLRDGGWKEEDVREMLMVDGCDECDLSSDEPLNRGHAELIVAMLSKRLLTAGWSRKDVVESLGYPQDCEQIGISDGGS